MTTQVPASMTVEGVTAAQLTGEVNNTGDETIAGVKTFTSQPVLPNDTGHHASRICEQM